MIAVVAGVALGAVFVIAGVAKIASRGRWPAQAAALGTPRAIAVVVPWVEIALGALVAVGVGMPWTGLAVLVVLAAYTGLILVRLDDPVRPPCACFGSWSARPLSWWSVARNVGARPARPRGDDRLSCRAGYAVPSGEERLGS